MKQQESVWERCGTPCKNSPPARREKPCGRIGKGTLLLFLLGGSGGLGGLRLGHALLEFIHAAGGIDKFLGAGVKGMADVANTQQNDGFGGAGFDAVAAGATEFRFLIFRM